MRGDFTAGIFMLMASTAGSAMAQTASAADSAAPDDTTAIIVTAQRKNERLSDVPIAIVARDADSLSRAGAKGIRDLTVVTPGMTVSGNGANVQPAIRGIHSDQTDPGNDANVAIYIDGVYQSSQLANNLELADIERIEVLKGPQGTLFGRNATGGAIRVFTREPTEEFAGLMDASYGNLNEFSAKGYVGGPIVGDSVMASVSGYYLTQDGYTRDITTGKTIGGVESYSVRGKLLLRPTDRFSIELIGGYVKRRDENATLYQPLNGNTVANAIPGAILPTRPRETAVTKPALTQSRQYSAAIKAELEMDAGTLSSISAYNDVRAFYYTDAEFSQLELLEYPIFERQKDFSQELTFASRKFGMVQATAGLFYFNAKGDYDPVIVRGSFVTPTLYGFMRQKTEAWAAFGEATITPLDRVSIILGARYSREKREATGSYFLSPVRPDPLPPLGDASFNSFTPRISLRYTLPSDDNVYATYSRGFKSGGFSISSAATSPFLPEKVEAFEIGLKSSTRRPVSANLSAFYYNYTDQQVQASVNGTNITSNAASSRIYGIDLDMTVRPTDALAFTVATSWLHARFKDYPNAVVNVPVGGNLGNVTAIVDASGLAEPYSPEFTLGLTGTYTKDIGPGDLMLSGTVYTSDKFYFDNNARVAQPAYTTLAARAEFTFHDTGVSVYAYGRNLTNELYFSTQFINNLGDGITYAAPRTYGVGAKFKF